MTTQRRKRHSLTATPHMNIFLRRTDVVDWDHPAVLQQAQALSADGDATATAKSCFEWVRDHISHSCDSRANPVTCRASDVLLHGTGYCFAKSHLLTALVRANGIPAGFCYQRLSLGDGGPPYSLHEFNALDLPGHGWYRVDARGNRPGVNAQFAAPAEQLAFSVQSAEEADFLEILPDPLECVIESLGRCTTWQEALASLPDVKPHQFGQIGLTPR